MYTVAWGQDKIINKTRIEFSEKLEQVDEVRTLKKKRNKPKSAKRNPANMSGPRPTFQNMPNRNRNPNNGRSQMSHQQQEPVQLTKEQEFQKYLQESWEQLVKQAEASKQNGHDGKGRVLYYKCNPAKTPEFEGNLQLDRLKLDTQSEISHK